MYRPDAAIRSIRSIAAGETTANHSPPSEPEVLLRREVVDVGLADLEVDAAGGARRVDDGQRARVAVDARDRCRDTGGGLVVRPGVNVDAVDRLRQRAGAGGHVANVGSLKPRRLRGGCELAAELAEHEVLAAVLDQAEGRGIPERRRSAVADDDLVAGGKAEQLGEVRADICRRGSSRAPGGARCRGATLRG